MIHLFKTFLILIISLFLFIENSNSEINFIDSDSKISYQVKKEILRNNYKKKKIEKYIIKTNNEILTAVRYTNSKNKKQPILIIHGLQNNSFSTKKLADRLFSQGHDVWMCNLRGHGDGSDKSVSLTNKVGAYGFEKMFSVDIPLFVDMINKVTNKKIILIGHSMGAASSKIYLSGIRPTSSTGNYITDIELSNEIGRKKVEMFFAIAPPSEFSRLSDPVKMLATLINPTVSKISSKLRFNINFLFKKNSIERTKSDYKMIEKLVKMSKEKIVRDLTKTFISRGVLDTKNLTNKEINFYMQKGVTVVGNTDIWHDFIRWAATGRFLSRDRTIDFAKIDYLPVENWFIIGDKDTLVKVQDIKNQSTKLGMNSKVSVFKDASHLPFISNAEVNVLSSFIKDAIQKNVNLDNNLHYLYVKRDRAYTVKKQCIRFLRNLVY